MQQKKSDYCEMFLFLYELINVFTSKLNIQKRFFYFTINKVLQCEPVLAGSSYCKDGLINFEKLIRDCRKAGTVYKTLPYLSALSRVLAAVYQNGSDFSGEQRTRRIFQNSLVLVGRKYHKIPCLEGYVPWKPALAWSEGYSAYLMDRMIEYLVKDVVAGRTVFAEINAGRKLPVEKRDYLHFYLVLEKYIVGTLGFSVEDVRARVREQFNHKWFVPQLRALFDFKDADKVVFLELILKAVLKNLAAHVDSSTFQKIAGEPARESVFEKLVDEKQLLDAGNGILKLLSAVNLRVSQVLGISRAKSIFSTGFNEVSRYSGFSAFADAVKSLPSGILEGEKFGLLGKEALEKHVKRLSRIEAVRAEFTNILAHELRSPLFPLREYIGEMQKSPEQFGLTRKAREYINLCLKSVERLGILVQEALDINKLESSEMKFDMKVVDMTSLLKEVVSDFSSAARKKNLFLKLEIPQRMPVVLGDSLRLSQAISNLITNALKFTEKGGVTVRARVLKNKILVEVADTGIGISKENIPKLFAKFFQIKTAVAERGTGLGLAISKQIILAHHGDIFAKSGGLGKGSAFGFSLPVAE